METKKYNRISIAIVMTIVLFLTIAMHFVYASEPRISPEMRARIEERISLLQYEYNTAEARKPLINKKIEDLNAQISTQKQILADIDRLQQDWKNEADGHRMELAGTQPFVPEKKKEVISPKPDVTKICKAIAYAETSNCTKGAALTHNNCHGIRVCSGGRCYGFRHYQSTEESFSACESVWTNGYGGRVPTEKDAEVYTGNDHHKDWYRIVHHYLSIL